MSLYFYILNNIGFENRGKIMNFMVKEHLKEILKS